jgi:hypothetical protein
LHLAEKAHEGVEILTKKLTREWRYSRKSSQTVNKDRISPKKAHEGVEILTKKLTDGGWIA